MTSSAIIRQARPEDLSACADIVNGWVDETEWMPRTVPAKKVVAMFNSSLLDKRHLLVADCDGEIGGYLSLDAQDGHVHGFYIAPQFRGVGVGKAFIAAAKEVCPNGLTLWTFQKNDGAQRFYQREGFREIRRTDGDNDEGLPDIFYQWQPDTGTV